MRAPAQNNLAAIVEAFLVARPHRSDCPALLAPAQPCACETAQLRRALQIPAKHPDRHDALLAALQLARDVGVHSEDCKMLHYSIDPDDWKACSCWYGPARSTLADADVPRATRGVA
jgi:hypothetical protein